MIFTSEIIKYNEPTSNGNLYSKECIERALNDELVKERFENHTFFCGFAKDYAKYWGIDISNISHVVNKTWWEGDTLFGEFKTLDTPCGKILNRFLSGCAEDIRNDCMTICGSACCYIENGITVVDYFRLDSINFTTEKS